jgi:hypothetical protein
VDYLDYPVVDGDWIAALVTLSPARENRPASLNLVVADDALDATVIWPDGQHAAGGGFHENHAKGFVRGQ